jgi:hypothetical protein
VNTLFISDDHIPNTATSETFREDTPYETLNQTEISESEYKTLLPHQPNPELPTKNKGQFVTKDAFVNLPLQHVPSNRRIDDLDEDEYGYEASSVIFRLKKDTKWEDAFVDVHEFLPYQKDCQTFMISKFFFPEGKI